MQTTTEESQVINSSRQSVEVINDSNQLLIIQTNNGTCYQVPGEAQIYPLPLLVASAAEVA